jgi:hypothetical protein
MPTTGGRCRTGDKWGPERPSSWSACGGSSWRTARDHPRYSHLVGRRCVPMAQAGGKGSATAKGLLAIVARNHYVQTSARAELTKAPRCTGMSDYGSAG